MPSPSNLYAEKVFSEHPSGLWSLDEKVDYVQFLTAEPVVNFNNWQVIGNASITGDATIIDAPFQDALSNIVETDIQMSGGEPINQFETIELISPDAIDLSAINQDLGNFSIGVYLRSNTQYLDSVEIGYIYKNVFGNDIVFLKKFSNLLPDRYLFLSETFDIPIDPPTAKIYIKLSFFTNSDNNYKFEFNGLGVGQWSEEFNSSSMGASLVELPSSIPITSGYYAVPAYTYGISENPGYYLVNNNRMYCKNSGIPLVYGSENSTLIYPHSDGVEPSLIIPGMGFMNESGKYRSQTLEFWARINSDSTVDKRIVGPMRSEDGIYVSGPFLKLKVGPVSGSHYVSEWSRPMLINLRITPSVASLLVNGEEVINLPISESDISYPPENDEQYNNDWIGFYAHNDVSPFEVDCVAIYDYVVPAVVAKRRWVYGQAVEFPENINAAYAGTSTVFDYQFADYTNNYSYPDIGSWNNGVHDNVSVSSSSISAPGYDLPSLASTYYFEWNPANYRIQDGGDTFFKISPEDRFNENAIVFDRIGFLTNSVRGFYMVVEDTEPSYNQVLFTLSNDQTGDSFRAEQTSGQTNYIASINGVETVVLSTKPFAPGSRYVVGLDLPTAATMLGTDAGSILGNYQNLRLIIGNSKLKDKLYTGKIYSVCIFSYDDMATLSGIFNQYGTISEHEIYNEAYDDPHLPVDYDAGGVDSGLFVMDADDIYSDSNDSVLAIISNTKVSYCVYPFIENESLSLKIATFGSWKDYVPLSYFAENVSRANGDLSYEVDFLQLNVSYPAPSIYKKTVSESSWTYDELSAEFSSDIQADYNQLSNPLFSGYEDYESLSANQKFAYSYDTSSSLVKTYVTFHQVGGSPITESLSYSNIIDAPKTGVITPGDEWINSKYEFVDNMVIYVPKTFAVEDMVMAIHVELIISDLANQPVSINKIQIASQSFDYTSPKSIGTKFGTPVYPYTQTGIYYNYKGKNPFSIYKGSTPHLYLTRKSGVTLRGEFDPGQSRGLAIPVNRFKVSNYEMIAMQFFARYDQDFFPYGKTEILEVKTKNTTIRFYLEAIQRDGLRAKIYAVNALTGELQNGIGYYLNGKVVKNPVISVKEWNAIGISFGKFLNFNSYTGYIRINGPLTIANISQYESTALQQSQITTFRLWARVLESGTFEYDWSFWELGNYSWYDALVLASIDYYGVNPAEIYKSYTGTNKIIVGDSVPFTINKERYSLIVNAEKVARIVSAI